MNHLSIASVWTDALIRALHREGLDVAVVVAGLPGFERGRLAHQGRLDLLSVRQLWHRADRLARDPLLGAKVGLQLDFRSIGVLAPLLWHSPTVAVALQHVATYQTLISDNGAFRFDAPAATGSRLRCRYEETPAPLAASPQQILSVLATTLQHIRQMFGGLLQVLTLWVPAGAGLDCRSLARLLDVAVAIGDRQFCIDLLLPEQPIAGCDETLYLLNLDYAQRLLAAKQSGAALLADVRRLVASHGMARASIEQCAGALHSHPRQLQRQLAQQGTGFRQLREAELKARAIGELNRGLAPEHIAERLGYSEASAFYRAFKKWFGVSPRQWARRT